MDEATRLRRIMERAAALLEAPGACERCRAVARTLRRSAVPVMRWIGRRIDAVEAARRAQQAKKGRRRG